MVRGCLRKATQFAVDAIYPKRCASCGRRGTWLCDDCRAALKLFAPPWCDRCGVPVTYSRCRCESLPDQLAFVRAAGPYDGWLRDAIVTFKYHSEWGRGEHLGPLVTAVAASVRGADTVVPVPLHRSKLRMRGYNQSLILATSVARGLDLPLTEALVRSRRTDPQVHLGERARRINVQDAFTVSGHVLVAGRNVMLIDDVITTGATLGACAEALLHGGAATVSAALVAREM